MKVFELIVSFVLFFAGLGAMGYAAEAIGFQGFVFFAGILMVCASFALPIHVYEKFD